MHWYTGMERERWFRIRSQEVRRQVQTKRLVIARSCEMCISVLGQLGAPVRVAQRRVKAPSSLGCICALETRSSKF